MDFIPTHTFNKNNNRHYLNNWCTVLHCHHYATLMTQLALYADQFKGEQILKQTSEDVFYAVLADYFSGNDIQKKEDKVSIARDYYRFIGMGLIDFVETGNTIQAKMEYSHIDEGWLKKWGNYKKPVNIITRGFIEAVAAHIGLKTPSRIEIEETKSLCRGDDVSQFDLFKGFRDRSIEKEPDPKQLTLSLPTNIDRLKVIKEMSKVAIQGDEHGLINAFGVYVQQLPASFWNEFAQRFMSNVPDELTDEAEYLLINCARECGYHTGHGIITSDIFNEVVGPMIKQVPEDILHGAFSVFTAWGWAMSEIVELIPNEKMVVRCYNYYEADIKAIRPAAYMIRGVCAAFMGLAYGGPYDPTGQKGMNAFVCEQTKGLEIGDEYGEFIVTPNR